MLDITISQEIIDGCKQKHQQAQSHLYKISYAPFMKICLRYASCYEDAANILHDGFIKIFTKIELYNGTGDFVGWMRRIIVNTAIDYTRLKKDNSTIDIEGIADVPQEQEEEQFVVDEAHILKLIRSLPTMQATVFNLFVLDDYSHEEIAKALNITVELSRWNLFNARKKLKEQLSQLKK